MKFPRPHIGDFVKVKVTGAGIDTVGIVVGKLLFHNDGGSASVPVYLAAPHKGEHEVTVHNTAVEIINENRRLSKV